MARYEFCLEGELPAYREAWFEGLTVRERDGVTVLSGEVVDQAALHGYLEKIRDLAIPLISVKRLEAD